MAPITTLESAKRRSGLCFMNRLRSSRLDEGESGLTFANSVRDYLGFLRDSIQSNGA